MTRARKTAAKRRTAAAHAEHVGTAEFRARLAKYLARARAGRPIVIQERGRDTYVLLRLEPAGAPDAYGCMRGRIEYAGGAVVNASEAWTPGDVP
jgi:prevent-host-death family protein